MKLLLLFPSPSDCVVSFACCMRVPFKTVVGGGDLLQDPVNGSHLRRKYSYELIGLWVLKSFAFALGGTTSGHELTIPNPFSIPTAFSFDWPFVMLHWWHMAICMEHGTWLKPKRKHVPAEAGRTRRDNETVSFQGVWPVGPT